MNKEWKYAIVALITGLLIGAVVGKSFSLYRISGSGGAKRLRLNTITGKTWILKWENEAFRWLDVHEP